MPPFVWHEQPDGTERMTVFVPGYVCPRSGWGSHGVHGMEIRWVVRRENYAVSWGVMTSWRPDRDGPVAEIGWPIADAIMWHRPIATENGWHRTECGFIDGDCYSDLSFAQGVALKATFLREGEAAIWRVLEVHLTHMLTEERE